MNSPRIVILVVGKKGAGKTTYLEVLIKKMQNQGKKVGGFICINEKSKLKKNYYLFDLNKRKSRLLATRQKISNFTYRYGKYYFNPQILEKGNQILKDSFYSDAIVVDEYGPLEQNHQGFFNGLTFLLNKYPGILIISSRPATIPSLKQLLSIGE